MNKSNFLFHMSRYILNYLFHFYSTGAGYHITISYRNPEKSKSIIQIVNSNISEAVIINQSEEWIKFGIPFTRVTEFPILFKQLESQENLEISRVGINCTTMEDVFLK